METTVIETTCFYTSLEDGVIRTVVKPGSDVTIEEAKENSEAVRTLNGKTPTPLLVDTREISSITKEARDFFSMRGRKGYVNSMALLIKSPLSKIVGNFFMGLNKPIVPTKLFNNEDEALKWLKKYRA